MRINLPNEKIVEVFPSLLVMHLGGEEAVDMLCDHHDEGMTYDELADKYGLLRASIHRRIVGARIKLRSLGLMPPRWEGRTRRGCVREPQTQS